MTKRRVVPLHLVLAIMLFATTARADDDEVPGFDATWHWQLEPGMRMGSVRLDGSTVGNLGGVVTAGVRLHRVMLAVELSELSVTAAAGVSLTAASGGPTAPPAGSSGTLDRFAALARVYLARKVESFDVLGDAWIAAGVGHERFSWDVGARSTGPTSSSRSVGRSASTRRAGAPAISGGGAAPRWC